MFITKSNFMTGLNCPRCFWKIMHEENMHKLTIAEAFRAEQGKKIGELAKQKYADGIDLSAFELDANLEKTKYYIDSKKTIFEAGFKTDNLYARIDILKPNDDGWDIIEVKSGSEVKEDYIFDVAFQYHVCKKWGLGIKNCYVLYVNTKYIKNGDINVDQFFVLEDVTEKVVSCNNDVSWIIEELLKIYEMPNPPEISISQYMFKGYPCELDSDCWSFLPEHHINNLYRIWKSKAVEYFKKGIFKITDIPDSELNAKHIIQKNAIINNQSYINNDGITNFLKGIEFPVYYLDFETFAEAVPRFDNTTPYRAVPFQFSLHVEGKDGNVKHFEYLHQKDTDPRLNILNEMQKVLGDKGSIIVFNESFEKSRLKELASDYPDYQEWVNGILDRIVDLIKPFTSFDYYNPKQKGSCSIKKVLPSITGKGYDGLEIGNGEEAYISYLNATFNPRANESERAKVYENLLTYCKLDTEGMVWIMDELRRMAG